MPKGDGDFHCDRGTEGGMESKCAPSSSFVFANRGTGGTHGRMDGEKEEREDMNERRGAAPRRGIWDSASFEPRGGISPSD